MKASHNPKEEMIDALRTVWLHPREARRSYIKNMWTIMMKPAQVLNWKSTGQSNEY